MHPPAEWAYALQDADVAIAIGSDKFFDGLLPVAAELGLLCRSSESLCELPRRKHLPQIEASRRAMILYTSGTTSKPKGVVSTHDMIAAQIQSLISAWEWTEQDRILHCLPLHHIHGIINVLCCALWSGAGCEFVPRFDVDVVWERFLHSDDLTLFMAVPTIYSHLIQAWQNFTEEEKHAATAGCQKFRLMVSGSAALPVEVLEHWRLITGHTLLERYGMTEIGMALSNPLHGERRPGHVGTPLPGVELRLVAEDGDVPEMGAPGEIQVRGATVFEEYWQRSEATLGAFSEGGWFRTGDIGECHDGHIRILGRSSVDIIKTGGYKVSALEIEAKLREHPLITQCAVVGLDDVQWGQLVCAAIELQPGCDLDLRELRLWGKERLAPYKVPSRLKVVQSLPRNAMGKVVKPEVLELFSDA
jgi:malonyl-CoA/methylmalonyl-CoA synthetase